jgi:hypothetical protein
LRLQPRSITAISQIECSATFPPRIKAIDLSDNTIVDFSTLERFENIEIISLVGCNVKALPSFAAFSRLQELIIVGNPSLGQLPIDRITGEDIEVLKEAGLQGVLSRHHFQPP